MIGLIGDSGVGEFSLNPGLLTAKTVTGKSSLINSLLDTPELAYEVCAL